MIKHHVKEEEQPGGMFAKRASPGWILRRSAAGSKMRKLELEKGAKPDSASAATRRLTLPERALGVHDPKSRAVPRHGGAVPRVPGRSDD